MGTVNLGRVRDRVTGVERINGNGSAGTIDTYRVSFESSNYYDFNVTNGRNGVGQIVSFSGDSDSRNNLIVRIVNNQDKVLALLVKSNSESEVNDGYMQASFKVEKTAVSTEGLVTTSTYSVIAYGPTGSQLFAASCVQSNLTTVEPTVSIIISSGFKDCLDAWCLLYYNDSSTGITIDDELSDNSTNPVQNKVIAKFANDVAGTYATNDDLNDLETEVANIKNGTTHLFENITDSHGNPRFVEGDITMETITGVTQKYGKWSLSGTHLMIVISFEIDSGVTMPTNALLTSFSLPEFIYSKIMPLWSSYVVNAINVQVREKYAWFNVQNLQSIQLFKLNNQAKEMQIKTSSSTITTTAPSACRIQFDLIIDAS